MAPPITYAEKKVCYESSVWLPHFTNGNHIQALEALNRHQWITFMSTEPSFFLTTPLNQFYHTMDVDEESGDYSATVAIFTTEDHKESKDFNHGLMGTPILDPRSVVQTLLRIFYTPPR